MNVTETQTGNNKKDKILTRHNNWRVLSTNVTI